MPRTRQLPFNRLGDRHDLVSVEAELLGRERNVDMLPSSIGSVVGDGSLRPTRNNRYPFELRLGPHTKDTVQRNIETGYRIARAWSGHIAVNYSCGFHVHLDMSRVDRSVRQQIIRRWLTYEPLFWTCTPSARVNNRFAVSLHRRGSFVIDQPSLERYVPCTGTMREWEDSEGPRYLALNPASFGRHSTYEIRMQAGIATPRRAVEWAYVTSRALSLFASTLSTLSQ